MTTQRRIAPMFCLGLGLAAATAATATAQGPVRSQSARPVPAPAQAAPAVRAPLPGSSHYAANLGIWYRLVPYGGAFGARLTHHPQPGSAASQLQLEPGDMIIRLDGQWLYGPNDVLAHVARTDVEFVNIRTGRPQSGVVFIPQGTQPVPPVSPPTTYSLGIFTVPAVVTPPPYQPLPGLPAPIVPGVQAPMRGLRITSVNAGGPAWRAGVQANDVIVAANGAATVTNDALRAVTASSQGVVSLRILKWGNYHDVREVVVDMRNNAIPQPAAGAPAAAAVAPAPR